jgi:group II intron reverse transcriptase/maturase
MKGVQEMSNKIRIVQSSFAKKALAQPDHRFNNLYFLICREDWIAQALEKVLSNKGARTPGVDGVSKKDFKTQEEKDMFVQQLRQELKAKTYRPLPVERQWIPKPGKMEERPLGIPTMKDKVVQQLLRMLLEPIWESDFLPVSHGFRPGHRTMDCIRPLWRHITRHQNYWWAVEGDISKCFDRVNHEILLKLVAKRVDDKHIMRLLRMLLKTGVMENGVVHTTEEGTPQGGILSPLLMNIYLHELDTWWYRNWGCLTPKQKQQRRTRGREGTGEGNVLYWRYADDFTLLTNGTRAYAYRLREHLCQFLEDELHLELNMDKTRVTHAKDGFDFLGFHVQWVTPPGKKPWLRVTPSDKNIQRFKAKIQEMTAANRIFDAPDHKIAAINRVTRGWINYYRYSNVKEIASKLDYWVNQKFVKWARRKHSKGVRYVLRLYKARQIENGRNRWNLRVVNAQGKPFWLFKMSDVTIERYRDRAASAWQNPYIGASQEVPTADEEPPVDDRAWIGRSEGTRQRNWALKVKADAHYTCEGCGGSLLAGEVKELHAHHRVSKSKGGSLHPNNAKVLCQRCHVKVHKS